MTWKQLKDSTPDDCNDAQINILVGLSPGQSIVIPLHARYVKPDRTELLLMCFVQDKIKE